VRKHRYDGEAAEARGVVGNSGTLGGTNRKQRHILLTIARPAKRRLWEDCDSRYDKVSLLFLEIYE